MTTEEMNTLIEVRDALYRIELSLSGDAKMGHRGIVARLECVEKAQAEHAKRFLVWGSMFTGAAMILTHFKSAIFKN